MKNYSVPSSFLAASIFVLLLFSCSSPTQKDDNALADDTGNTGQSDLADSDTKDTPPKVFATGKFFEEDLPGDLESKKWLALVPDADDYTLRSASIFIQPLPDTGESCEYNWSVTTDISDSCFLIENTGLLQAGQQITPQTVPPTPIEKGRPLSFNYNQQNFTIYSKSTTDGPAWYLKDEEGMESLLIVGEMGYMEVIFAADLDGDNALDLIMKNPTHYNLNERALYLSSLAGKDQLVKFVSSFTTVGC